MRTDVAPAAGTEWAGNSTSNAGSTRSTASSATQSEAKKNGGDGVEQNEAQVKIAGGSATQPAPTLQPNELHVQIEAPFVFRGKANAAAAVVPANEAADLPVLEPTARPAI